MTEHSIHLTNKLQVSGVKKVDSYSKTRIVLCLEKKHLIIDGDNFELGKLDTTGGIVEATGEIRSIKYQTGVLGSKLMDKLTK